jgi:hypothetical protein
MRRTPLGLFEQLKRRGRFFRRGEHRRSVRRRAAHTLQPVCEVLEERTMLSGSPVVGKTGDLVPVNFVHCCRGFPSIRISS